MIRVRHNIYRLIREKEKKYTRRRRRRRFSKVGVFLIYRFD